MARWLLHTNLHVSIAVVSGTNTPAFAACQVNLRQLGTNRLSYVARDFSPASLARVTASAPTPLSGFVEVSP
jgi:hypothetical protein